MDFKDYFRTIDRNIITKVMKGEYKEDLDLYTYTSKGITTHTNLYLTIPNFKTKEHLWSFLVSHLPEGYKVGAYKIHPKDVFSVLGPLELVHQSIEFLELYNEGSTFEDITKGLEYTEGETLVLPTFTHYFKLSQLAQVYVKAGMNFKYPPTANKILNLPKYFLHPGGFRQVLYQVFSPDKEITVVGLADDSVEVLQEFDSTNSVLEYFGLEEETTELDVTLQGFENLLLPQFAFGYKEYHSKLKEEFTDFINFYDSVNIYTDFLFKHVSRNQSKVKKEYYIELEHKEDPVVILQFLLLLPFLNTPDEHYITEISGAKIRVLTPTKTKK